jgi:D-alanine--poly(phosphoribitol) ligase subunit 1
MLINLAAIFDKFGNRNALYIKGKYYSYKELSKKITTIAQELKNNSGEKSKLIGVICADEFETYASFFAVWFSGYGFVPINPHNPYDRNNNILQQTKIEIVLAPHRNLSNILETKNHKIIYTNEISGNSTSLKIPVIKDNQVMCILFTSGSTGTPKGVPMTLKNINSTIDAFCALGYTLSEEDRFLQMFEFTFDMSMLSYLPAFLLGACVYSVSDAKVKYLAAIKIMQDCCITFAAMVPSTLTFLRPFFKELKLDKLRYSLLGGEPFYKDIAAEWARCVPNALIVNISGPTETTMACMGYNLHRNMEENKAFNGILAFGKPWKNTKAIIIDENMKPVPVGIKGELCFAGDNVMDGYWKMPEKNREVFFNLNLEGTIYRFYRTGDMAYADEDGDLMTCGRVDQQVKIQGHKVELAEIEILVREYIGNTNVVVLSESNNKGIKELFLFIEKQKTDTQKIIDFLKTKVPWFMIPKEIIQLEVFPTNINGKIDRLTLLSLIQKNE